MLLFQASKQNTTETSIKCIKCKCNKEPEDYTIQTILKCCNGCRNKTNTQRHTRKQQNSNTDDYIENATETKTKTRNSQPITFNNKLQYILSF